MDNEQKKEKLGNLVLHSMSMKTRDKYFVDERLSSELLFYLSDEILNNDPKNLYFYTEKDKFEVFSIEGVKLHHYTYNKDNEGNITSKLYKYNQEPFLIAFCSENKDGYITYKNLDLYYDRELKNKVVIKNGENTEKFVEFMGNF
ncbi:hypothetical protein [Mammaliicoccus sciuri]|uniref:hypothetical protein n=1 Tax=Mammaliicoccus sciuri TaxID=1296 RepID=UPI0008075E48|nr:hypothetical protein [Mammaliicoccus sciuri]OCA12694.1 hypothetical protein BBD66_07725 [Mammaliicoccus sciuri]